MLHAEGYQGYGEVQADLQVKYGLDMDIKKMHSGEGFNNFTSTRNAKQTVTIRNQDDFDLFDIRRRFEPRIKTLLSSIARRESTNGKCGR